MKSICVFCGSGSGNDSRYMDAAYQLGQLLAEKNIKLIYGGAKLGLMGAVADGVLSEGGTAIGVIPHFLCTKEVAHGGLSELMLVDTMHERKLKMHELSDGIITMPGGWGTMEEMFEMLTWGQLGMHQKPIGLYNINGYYDGLRTFHQTMVNEGFLKRELIDMLMMNEDADGLLAQMERYTPPVVPRWITEETT
ncbi:MAG: TIGR00730 family Rossman fold protein [Sphingobacteriales bacterium]|nr:MAG: TIGR00730 family Rossman fold protein [Sphingobacteriales bacterium]